MTRYSDDLKKIVGIDELNIRIKELQDQIQKDRIDSKRGIGYALADGAVQGATAATGSGKAPSNALGSNDSGDTKELTDAALEALNGQLNGGSGGTEPGTSGNDSLGGGLDGDQGATIGGEDGVFNIADILAGAGVQPGDGRRLLGVSGIYDVLTNRQMIIREDGYYRSPEDRFTWDIDGEEFGFVLGYRWPGGVDYYPTAGQCIAGEWQRLFYGGNESPPGSGNKYEFLRTGSLDVSGTPQVSWYVRQIVSANVVLDPPGSEVEIVQGAVSCVVGTDSACLGSVPVKYKWPLGAPLQLGKNDLGQFKASPRDNDIPAIYTVGSNKIIMGYGVGNYATQRPTKDGGFIIGKSDISGNYTDFIIVYNGAGQNVGIHDASLANAYALP